MATVQEVPNVVLVDPDGKNPPGLRQEDLALLGQKMKVRFEGVFFARPELGYITFSRAVVVWFASVDIFVVQDLEHGNLYVIDRRRDISLACLMIAYLEAI